MSDDADVRLRYRIEYAVMRLGLGLLDGLSLPTAERWARRVGDFWFAVDRRRRQVACDNIKRPKVNGVPETVIYTIQVNTNNDAESAVLKSCGQDSGGFFSTTTAAGIATVFEQVGASLTKLRVAN